MLKFDVTFMRTATEERIRQIIDSTSKAKLLEDARKQGCVIERCVELPDPFAGIIPKPKLKLYRYLVTAQDDDGVEVEFIVRAADEFDMKASVNPARKVIRYRFL